MGGFKYLMLTKIAELLYNNLLSSEQKNGTLIMQ